MHSKTDRQTKLHIKDMVMWTDFQLVCRLHIVKEILYVGLYQLLHCVAKLENKNATDSNRLHSTDCYHISGNYYRVFIRELDKNRVKLNL